MTGEKKASAIKYHRRTLLDAADRLLTEYGYDGMNMNMLAKEAGYSKATVYVYFSSKDEIVAELALRRLELMRSELKLLSKSDLDTDEKFAEIRKTLDEFNAEDGVYFDFICALRGDEPYAREIKADIADILSDLSDLAPEAELKARWYSYYGRVKTKSLFD